MNEERSAKEKAATKTRIWGASIAWIVVYGALIGVTALIPIFPYVGGGGFLPLCVVFEAIAPLILGPAGIIAAFIGGIIGMFIMPAAFPLGLLDVFFTGILPSITVSLTIRDDKFRYITVPLFAVIGIFFTIFPYYWPGAAAGLETNPPEPLYTLLAAWYWVPWLVIEASPLGTKIVPKWSLESSKKRYWGIFIAVLSGMMIWWMPWAIVYWYLLHYPIALAIATFIAYSWWVPVLSIITTIIAVPIVEGLRRSGLPKIHLAIW